MLLCQCNADIQPNVYSQQEVDWTSAGQAYPNLEEMPSFICQQWESAAHLLWLHVGPQKLQEKQLRIQAYSIVRHMRIWNIDLRAD